MIFPLKYPLDIIYHETYPITSTLPRTATDFHPLHVKPRTPEAHQIISSVRKAGDFSGLAHRGRWPLSRRATGLAIRNPNRFNEKKVVMIHPSFFAFFGQ